MIRKTKLRQLVGLASSPRNGATYHPRTVVQSKQSEYVILGSEKVGSPFQGGSVNSGSQSNLGQIHICKHS